MLAGQFRSCRTLLVVLFAVVAWSPSSAQSIADTTTVVVEATADALAVGRVSSSDTASLLVGVDSEQAGGVSSLVSIHGLADDRVRTLVNGMPVAAACPMHMNPPLSYIDPSNVAKIEVLPGVTPVSFGGDSIGGTILVDSPAPTFAATDQAIVRDGRASSFYRSNGSAVVGAAAASVASSDLSLGYQGSVSQAGDYRDAEGDRINASRFETSNQQITAAYRNGQDLYAAQAMLQYLPYEGFPNADMDMTANVGAFVNVRYEGSYEWGGLKLNAYYDHIRHEMNGNAPDRYPPSLDITGFGAMPTQERAQDYGYRLKADIAASPRSTLRVGNEVHAQTLDDRWPGAPAGMMFDFVDINNATRTQVGTFAEWERHWNRRWITLVGARNDLVWMDTGPVQGYDGLDPTARAFNASHRARADVNFDATMLSRYEPDEQQNYSVGIARKNRSPNFYERYAWGTNTIGTVTWFGDGNGYTGKPDLKPETAYTASIAADWHDRSARQWELRLSPYLTVVENYIGAVPICGQACSGQPASQLLFVNQRARLYGVDASAAITLSEGTAAGVIRLTGTGGFVHGEDLSTQTGLYHMMPLHGSIALQQQRGAWSGSLELRAVNSKTDVDAIRHEPETPGYAILNFRTDYTWRSVRLDVAITNALDRQYENPLGGSWQSALYPPGYSGATFHPLPARGRSFDTGVTVRF